MGYEKCIQDFGWKTEGKRLLRRLRCRWEDNIRMDLGETGWEGVDWEQWRAHVNTVMNLQDP